MSTIVWKVDFDTAESIYNLGMQLDIYEIDLEEYQNKMSELPGYPLTRLLNPGDDLRVVLNVKTTVVLPKKESQKWN